MSENDDGHAPTEQRVRDEFARQSAKKFAPGLHIVSTPIGNLGDITLRAIATLAAADAILCEDTRHSRRLLGHYSIRKPLMALHDHNEREAIDRVLHMLGEGKVVALVSDAGTPLIADPGYKLALAAWDAGHTVTASPGVSAPITALALSGLPTDKMLFLGFLPPKSAGRRAVLAQFKDLPATLVAYESPNRIAAALKDAQEALGDRSATVARELTKLHETIHRGTLASLAAEFEGATAKGEIVLLIGPAPEREVDKAVIRDAMEKALQTDRLKDAARRVANDLGISKNVAYSMGQEIKDEPR